jgi:glucokinase-like ROK family protein
MFIKRVKHTVYDLRRLNRSTILQFIYFNSPISRLEISQRSGLSPSTLTNIVSELLDEGVVLESGLEESSGGRRRTKLVINPKYGYLIGIDVGETHIQLELFDITLRRISDFRYTLPTTEFQADFLVNRIVECLRELMSKAKVPLSKVIGVGIGFPGIVDQRRGISIFTPNWGWHNIPIVKMLEEKIKLPFFMNNGAQVMTLAEGWFGAGKGVDDVSVLLIGTGVGAGILTQGSLHHGVINSAGEWGHTSVDLDGRLCHCGSHGCIEAYAGAPNIIARLKERDPETSLTYGDDQIETIMAIREAAEAGHSTATAILKETATYLGVGVANILNLFNPQMIIIGGWVGVMLGEYMLPDIRATAQRYALKPPFEVAQLTLSKFGDEAISLGAACLALEGFLKSESTPVSVR